MRKTDIEISPIVNLQTQSIDVQNGSKRAVSKLTLKDIETTRQSLKEFLSESIDKPDLQLKDDLISCGLDSLQIISLMRAINAAREEPIEAKQIYDHPTMEKLARSLHDTRVKHHYDDWDSDGDTQKESWLRMERMYNEFTAETGEYKRTGKELLQSTNAGPVFQPDGAVVAWLQVLGSFLINVNNWGLVNTFGVFQAYYSTTLLRNHSSVSITFISSLQGALLLIVGVVSGPLFDAGYFEFLLIAASIGLVFSLMMLSLSTQYYQVILSQGVLLGFCSGLLYIPSVAVIPLYFKHQRGLALGLATGGGSIGGVIYPIIFRRLLDSVGFPWATRIICFIALGTRRQLVDPQAFQEVPYIAFMIAAFFIYAAVLVPFFLCATFASEALHTSTNTAFYMVSVFNALQFFGRLIPSWFMDLHPHVFGPEVMMALAEIVAAVLGYCWIAVHSLRSFVPWSMIYGFVSGMIATLPAIILPHICPNLAVYGTRLGMVYACAGVGVLVSTPVAAAANSMSKGFLGSQVWTGTCCTIAVMSFVFVALDARKKRLLFEKGRSKRMGRKALTRQKTWKDIMLKGWSTINTERLASYADSVSFPPPQANHGHIVFELST